MPDRLVLPKSDSWKMFNAIAGRYDFLNRLLSLGQDVRWRRALKKFLPDSSKQTILDLATGTADVLIVLSKDNPKIHRGYGVDPAVKMLEIGRQKIKQQHLDDRLMLQQGDAQELPFLDETFDCVTISFGIRNIPDLRLALLEMYRVTKQGGRVLILEFSKPENPLLKAGHWLYLQTVVPLVGFLFSGNFKAYFYLNQTIQTFPYGDLFCKILKQMGFVDIQPYPLMGGPPPFMSPTNNLLSLKEAQDQMSSLVMAYKPSPSIVRIEIKIHPVDMLSWLSLQRNEIKIYGANQSDTVSIAGIGQAACVTGRRLGTFKKIFEKLRSFLSPKYPYLQWYGGFCFDERHQDTDWKEFGAYRFVLPRFELAAQSGKMIFCCNLIGRENVRDILKQLSMIVIPSFDKAKPAVGGREGIFSRRIDKPDQKFWQKDVDRILADTSVKKVVLARKTTLFFKQTPDPWAMLRQLKAVTPNSYHFAFQFKKTVFLGASPERLYRRYARCIGSEALAGTMPKSTDPGLLLNSDKNKREHALVVDAIHASFKEFCTSFSQEKHPGVLTLPNGHHLITKFQGQLKDGINDEDIIQFLHPTPALGGTPRKRAMAIIRKLEGFSRGWYGAPIGYVGLDWAEFVVGIRSGLASTKKLSVFAGAGIVRGSEASLEWNEVENKISNFIRIIR